MSLKIRAIREKGVLAKERVVLYSDSSEEIGQYLVSASRSEGTGMVSSELRHTIWLPDHKVEAGDLVVVYSKKSDQELKVKANEDGTKTTFVYWGLDRPIFDHEDSVVVLMKIGDWSWKSS
ncbi:TPA: hypothetical protein QDE31_25105 [Burkholderia cenocepacia]|uniref:hypothetical protein n=1 Tax=Burkholderia cepacia complex TaxID=87882 RepID=UPI000F5DA103|nr:MULTISPECIES: hypothetical protein [Burkholderia cepacia complex]RQT32440.1 hypothetical protein DF135_20570 [Burkholderia cepacia]HDR9873018.1 hypothetical protein [Burkholderia cenocepacia]